MIPNAILVILITSALLTLCGAIAWVGERIEAMRARRAEKRKLNALRVGRRSNYFHDGAVQP